MKDDPLLDALAETAKAQDPLSDPRWEGLVRGTLSHEDEAALAELAARSEDGKTALAAFRPLGGDARGRIADKLLANIQARKAPKKRLAQSLPWAFVAAAVLGGAVWLGLAPPGDDGLPAYTLSVSNERDVRGPETPEASKTAPIRLGPGGRLEVVMRPATAVKGSITARAFLVRDGQARAWVVPVVVATTGAVRVAGSRETLFAGVRPGTWEMVFAVGPLDALPNAKEVLSAVDPEASKAADARPVREQGRYRLLRRTVTLVPEGGDPPPP